MTLTHGRYLSTRDRAFWSGLWPFRDAEMPVPPDLRMAGRYLGPAGSNPRVPYTVSQMPEPDDTRKDNIRYTLSDGGQGYPYT
jgi:hypothetical protein